MFSMEMYRKTKLRENPPIRIRKERIEGFRLIKVTPKTPTTSKQPAKINATQFKKVHLAFDDHAPN